MAAPIACVTRFRVLATERLLFALADNDHAIGGNTNADQIVADRRRSPLPESEVVLVGAARVGMAFNADPDRRPSTQVIRVPLQRGPLVVADVELVVIEGDVREVGCHLLECFRAEQIFF